MTMSPTPAHICIEYITHIRIEYITSFMVKAACRSRTVTSVLAGCYTYKISKCKKTILYPSFVVN